MVAGYTDGLWLTSPPDRRAAVEDLKAIRGDDHILLETGGTYVRATGHGLDRNGHVLAQRHVLLRAQPWALVRDADAVAMRRHRLSERHGDLALLSALAEQAMVREIFLPSAEQRRRRQPGLHDGGHRLHAADRAFEDLALPICRVAAADA